MSGLFGVIGAGNMAAAIVKGMLGSGAVRPEDIGFFDTSEERRGIMKALGLRSFPSAASLVSECRYVLLSVKPQVIDSVMLEAAPALTEDAVVISIAAGISTGHIRELLGEKVKVVRVMPNTPLMVGKGAAAVCRTENVSDAEFAFAKKVFTGAGIAEEIDESKMNAVIAVNGSTPAYIYLFAEYFCEYAEKQGISFDVANRLFCQTLVGSAEMMTSSGMSHTELIKMVSSPGGTTLAGLDELKKHDLKAAVDACCEATVKRAAELGK